MKLRIPWYTMLKIALIAFAVGAVVLFFVFFNLFVFTPWDEGWQWVVILIYLALMVGLYIALSVNRYYVVEKRCLVVNNLGKPLTYYYKDIIYINEERSRKKKTVTFVMNNGKTIYLAFDKKGVLLDELLKKCDSLLSDEEFARTHPGFKF